LEACVTENKEVNQYEQQIALLSSKLQSHKVGEDFDKVRKV